jgi:ribosomal protein S18 acetylase RimI-like enzyme
MRELWLNAENVDAFIPRLHSLLAEAVAEGASIGFMWPVNHDEIATYWHDVAHAVSQQKKYLVVILGDDESLLGTAQLEPSPKENGRHRAEVQKVIVAVTMRNRGVGRLLMQCVEHKACDLGRTMLFLDTRVGDVGERLYVSMGWQKFGIAPEYAYSPNGELEGSAFYYKRM